jgi:hypothetical protein
MPSPPDVALHEPAEIEALLTASAGTRVTIERIEPLHHPRSALAGGIGS